MFPSARITDRYPDWAARSEMRPHADTSKRCERASDEHAISGVLALDEEGDRTDKLEERDETSVRPINLLQCKHSAERGVGEMDDGSHQ